MATVACTVSVAGAYVNGSASSTNYFGSYPGGSNYYVICLKVVIPAVSGGTLSSLTCSISGTNNNNSGAIAAKTMRYGFTTSATNTLYMGGNSTGGDGTFELPYCSGKYVTVTGNFDKAITGSMDSSITRYLWVWAGDVTQYSWYTYAGCTVTATYTGTAPEISTFSASQVSGTLTANCSWSITNNASTVTTEIRASTSTPSNYQTDGYTKGSFNYATTYATISFNSVGTYYVWLNLYNSGSYIGSKVVSITLSLTKPSAWSWTTAESTAFANKGAVSTLTSIRWNAFIAQINTAISYYNSAYSGSLTLIADSYKMGDDKILYASAFNIVYARLDALCAKAGVTGSGVSSDVLSGGIIYGSYFTSLSAALNRAIAAM